jgi:hypothetical protein
MQKKIISIVFVAAIAVAAAWNLSRNQEEAILSDVTLENIEALADGEASHGTCLNICLWHPNYDCHVYIYYPLSSSSFTCSGYRS